MDSAEFVVVLDRSGSMETAKSDHEGGLNSFVQSQRELPGDVRFTLIQFDSHNPCEVVYDGVPVADVQECKLVPRGGTPLLDAVGMSLAHVATRITTRTTPPDQVVVMIITDGEENSSREWTKERVKSAVGEKEAQGWRFLFLGANIDAFADAGGMGIVMDCALDFSNNAQGVQAAYAAVSSNSLRSRRMYAAAGASGQSLSVADVAEAYAFTDEQRAATMVDDKTNVGNPHIRGRKKGRV